MVDADPGTGELLVERVDGVAVLTLHRPKARNALTARLIRTLRAALAAADADDAVDVVVLTGADPAFCAGLDLGEVAGSGENLRLAQTRPGDAGPPPGLPWEPTGKPLIGAINGPAITGGFELALHCDILIASQRAAFADTHTRVGVLPSWGMSVLLPRAVGERRALRMSLSGEFLDPVAARDAGLVSEVVPHDDLLPAAHRLAQRIRASDPATRVAFLASARAIAAQGTADALAAESRAAAAWLERGFDAGGVAGRRAGIVAGNRGQLTAAPAAPAAPAASGSGDAG
ncbi:MULTISPECIES: enoyl-CoA hydratase [Frankia]|uniref:Enoyl-CoA hydratase/isomerase family protein n=1 Tax=Frankia alni (strain DSM 45986 / CECT 9034 / ACN14a) TaxID=326424 RepID=Q0RGH5_FRAAA|nr:MULTISPECIES: enoyl-CoA hydratase [Frankia]CAJ63412.1 putative enoyl-CoA hydratase/isomerase family protein [Frankia alni ACN14a]